MLYKLRGDNFVSALVACGTYILPTVFRVFMCLFEFSANEMMMMMMMITICLR